MFVFVLASGIVPALTHWHDDSPVAREVVRQRARPPSEGRVLRRRRDDAAHRRVARRRCASGTTSGAGPTTAAPTKQERRTARSSDFRAGVWMQTLLRDPAAGHRCTRSSTSASSCLFIVTVIIEIDHQLPESLKFLHGRVVPGVLGGRRRRRASSSSSASCWAIGRRYVQRPYRIRIKTKPEDAVILGTFLVIGAHRLLHRSAPHRARAAGPRSRSGRSSATRSRR